MGLAVKNFNRVISCNVYGVSYEFEFKCGFQSKFCGIISWFLRDYYLKLLISVISWNFSSNHQLQFFIRLSVGIR